MKPWRSAGRRNAGFVLIYVAAILVFLTTLVLQSTHTSRRLAALSARLQEQTLARERLRAGAMLLRARIEYALAQAQPAQRNAELLSTVASGGLVIDGSPIVVTLADADLRPDANQLTQDEWRRLLVAYGMDTTQAEKQAQRIEAARSAAGNFASVDDLADLPGMPARLLHGDSEAPSTFPPLAQLLSSEGGKRVHVQESPLPLFAALFDATPAQLGRLEQLRHTRTLSVDDALELFGSAAQALCYAGAPEKLRATLGVDGVPLRLEIPISLQRGQLVMLAGRWQR